MPDNYYDSKKSTEIKLLKLYEELDFVALKVIDLHEHILAAINKSDGAKLEDYSLIEKELVNKLVKIKQVIAGFESNCSISSAKLENQRARAAAMQKLIVVKGEKNRNTLKISLKKISSQIDTFSQKILYSASFSRQTAPRFVDLSI